MQNFGTCAFSVAAVAKFVQMSRSLILHEQSEGFLGVSTAVSMRPMVYGHRMVDLFCPFFPRKSTGQSQTWPVGIELLRPSESCLREILKISEGTHSK